MIMDRLNQPSQPSQSFLADELDFDKLYFSGSDRSDSDVPEDPAAQTLDAATPGALDGGNIENIENSSFTLLIKI